ncbi:MAG TPA: family 16 glycosylhydrolase [Ruminococcus sp.]|nr:family 16 glycosylhydrolase [Ruminococcus sp.]
MIGNYAKRLLSAGLAAALAGAFPAPQARAQEDVFFEDFSGSSLDRESWLIAEKNWGGTVTENGVTQDYNGGVIHENVSLSGGNLVLTGLGSGYEGELRGIARDGSPRADGKRCGGAIATREYFGSGSYEIRAKIAPVLGCCSAMWTFEYEEDYSDGLTITNHEIDIEFPGRDENDQLSLSHALCTTWTSEEDYLTRSPYCKDQADGEFHTYRFDWHTGSDTEEKRVDFYFDGELTYTSYDNVPTNESRFWLGLWFPKNWAGTPDFEQTEFLVDYVKITPFHEIGDTQQHESYPDSGWYESPAEIPKGWLLWHSYTSYSALDSRLFLRSPSGETQEITGDFIHPMNGSFGSSPDQFVFMALDQAADEWDIFLWEKGKVRNLTKNSGFNNEDPKFSPDGKSIVFKSGHWDSAAEGFVYDLALLDIATGAVAMITEGGPEESMPCFSPDGKYLYYCPFSKGIGQIWRMELGSDRNEPIFGEAGVNAYYPVTFGEEMFFTKWYSAEDHCDQIMRFDGSQITAMPFDSPDYDCSDPCPLEGGMIFSSTMNGGYDLYCYDGTSVSPLSELNTDKNELGAAFFPYTEEIRGDVNCDGEFNIADLVAMQKWLLAVPGAEVKNWKAGDLWEDERLNVFDLCLMRQELTER